jgi:hypothetical protein
MLVHISMIISTVRGMDNIKLLCKTGWYQPHYLVIFVVLLRMERIIHRQMYCLFSFKVS